MFSEGKNIIASHLSSEWPSNHSIGFSKSVNEHEQLPAFNSRHPCCDCLHPTPSSSPHTISVTSNIAVDTLSLNTLQIPKTNQCPLNCNISAPYRTAAESTRNLRLTIEWCHNYRTANKWTSLHVECCRVCAPLPRSVLGSVPYYRGVF